MGNEKKRITKGPPNALSWPSTCYMENFRNSRQSEAALKSTALSRRVLSLIFANNYFRLISAICTKLIRKIRLDLNTRS